MTNEHDIDKLFQDHLGPDSDPKGVWSDPGDEAFFAAMSEIDERKKDKRKPFFWWFTGALALLIISSFFFLNNRIDNVEAQLTTSTQQQEFKIGETNSNVNLVEGENESRPIDNSTSTIEKNQKGTQIRSTSIVDPAYISSYNTLDTVYTVSTSNIQDTPGQAQPLLADINPKSYIINTSTLIEILNPLPTLPGNINTSHTPIAFDTGSKKFDAKPPLKPSTVYIESAIHRTSWTMSDIQIPQGTLTEYDQYYTGWSAGLAWEKPLNNHWSILGKLGYQLMENHSIYKNKINFEENLVRNDNGEQYYDMTLTIANPMDKQTEPVSALMSNTSLTNGESLKQKTHIVHNLDWIYLSILPQYKLSINDFSIGTGIGLQANYLFQRKYSSQTEIYKATEVVMKEVSQHKSRHSENTLTLSAVANLRLNYSIGDHINVGTHFNYNIGINPINEQHDIRSGKTYVRDFSSGVYIGFNF